MCVDKFGVSWLADISQPRAWQLGRAHGRPTLPGDAGAVQEVRAIDKTPVRRRRHGYCAVLPHLRARATGRAPRFAARPRTAICPPRLSHGRKATEDGSNEQRSALQAAVYRGDGPAVVLQLAGDSRSLPGSATREGTDAWHGGWRYLAAPR